MKIKKSKILFIYHSGSGSTKAVTNVLGKKLRKKFSIDVKSVSNNFNYQIMESYDFIIFAFPTYHCEPSSTISEFIKNMPKSEKRIKSFIITTCGLYSGNSRRIFSKLLLRKNFITMGSVVICGPASDVILLFPTTLSFFLSKLSYVLTYKGNTKKKLVRTASRIESILKKESSNKPDIPVYKWYVPLNNIFKYFGEKKYDSYMNNMKVIKERCTGCNYCLKNCIKNCWEEKSDTLVFNGNNCEFCLKCVHNCPEKAITFSKEMMDKPRLNLTFYKNLKETIQ